jgi:uncharacterized coiled-coil DUF342 family protein
MGRIVYVPKDEVTDMIENNFTYHAPIAELKQAEKYEELRDAAKDLALKYVNNAPASRELSLALTNLEQSVFWVNAAIARNEKEQEPRTAAGSLD